MADPQISEIKYLGSGTLDFLEVRVPDDYPDPENLRLVIYDRNHNGSNAASPSASDIYNVTSDGLLYTEDTNSDGEDDDGVLHYTFGTSENGSTIRLHAQDAVGLYNVVTGETYGLYNWSGSSYTVSTATGDPFAGQTAELLDNTGQVNGVSSLELQPDGTYDLQLTPDPGSSYICFTPGTRILTETGERLIEDLDIGDSVLTRDFGVQNIRWIGHVNLVGLGTAHNKVQPITIKANAFGAGVPSSDLTLSPNHAVLNDNWKASVYFGDSEVLTQAKSLLKSDFAHRCVRASVTYYHILLDQHSLIRANGLWAESLYLGSQCMEIMMPSSRAEILELMPEMGTAIGSYGRKIRSELKTKEAKLLL